MFETVWDKYRLKCNYVVHRMYGSNVRLLSRSVYLRRNVVLVLQRLDSVVLVVCDDDIYEEYNGEEDVKASANLWETCFSIY